MKLLPFITNWSHVHLRTSLRLLKCKLISVDGHPVFLSSSYQVPQMKLFIFCVSSLTFFIFTFLHVIDKICLKIVK